MALHGLLLHQQLLLLLIISAVRAASQSNSSCERKCGNIEIPYPFGTSWDYSLSGSFLIDCNNMSGIPKPVLANSNIEVLNISLDDGELLVSTPLTGRCFNNVSSPRVWWSIGSKFPISGRKNKFIAVGCDIFAYVSDKGNYASACISICDSNNSSVGEEPCSGKGCCEASIPQGLISFNMGILAFYGRESHDNPCAFAFVVKKEEFDSPYSDLQNLQNKSTVPVVLAWTIANETCKDPRNLKGYACTANNSECHNSTNGPGYLCKCPSGFEGNAYIDEVCTDIDECKTPNPCNQTCHNTDEGYNCTCGKGHELIFEGNRTVKTGCHRIPVNQLIKASIIALSQLVISLMVKLSSEEWNLFWVICWQIWHQRNMVMHGGAFQHPLRSAQHTMDYLREYTNAQDHCANSDSCSSASDMAASIGIVI